MGESRLVSAGVVGGLIGKSTVYVRRLTDAGVLSSTRTPGGHRRYDLDTVRREWSEHLVGRNRADGVSEQVLFEKTCNLDGLAEDRVWAAMRDAITTGFGPLRDNVRAILGYATTEMVNNAIDHSAGSLVSVMAADKGDDLRIVISDDGVGAFKRIQRTFGYAGPDEAVVDITKGKRTTAPQAHSGEGIFFTSKAVDVFELAANGYKVVFDNVTGDVALGEASNVGTRVALTLALDSTRVLAEVFAAYTDSEHDFDKTTPRVSLVSYGGEFLSRSEAKRFALGLEKFSRVVLDFEGVPLVGQGFADELFRVWQADHPEIALEVVGANAGVSLMINRVAAP